MSKKYTITVRDYRDFYGEPERAFRVLSMINTITFKPDQFLSEAEVNEILKDGNSQVKVVPRVRT